MKISKLYKRERKLVRDKKNAELENFRAEVFVFPKSNNLNVDDGAGSVNSDKHVVTENRNLKRVIQEIDNENENLSIQVNRSERKVDMLLGLLEVINRKWQSVLVTEKERSCLEKQCSVWEQKFDKMSDQLNMTLEELEEKKQKLSKLNTRNVNKKLKRREEKIEKQSQKLKDQQNEISQLLCEKVEHESEVERMKREKRNLLVKISRNNKKERAVDQNSNQIASLKDEIRQK
ncbi:hypothetical protein DPMN_103853 [Dreissena polymorpha]|uniref:Uncharacterized protein n=1 Tax=Dreissena polymorpha TaxID=45954 RepID=A0A9D4HAV1_DREPO|nr:hypothetical protein DPMN_103853 [Dreissena polymorpha]